MQPFLSPLEAAEEKEYLRRQRAGDSSARHALMEHNMRLVAHIVKKYNGALTAQEDLMSAGMIGLCKAVDTFDADKGSRLVTYASRCIENEILMLLRQERKVSREVSLYEPLGQDKDGNEMSLIDLLEADMTDVESDLSKRQELALLPAFMRQVLSEKEKRLLAMRYGLDGRRPKTQKEVGDYFGISRSYVSRMEKKALSKLKQCYM